MYFASGQGTRLSVQGQIGKPHVLKVLQPAANLAQDQAARLVGIGHVKGPEKAVGLPHVQGIDLGDVQAVQSKKQGFIFESGSIAMRADLVGPVPREKHPHVHLVSLGLQPVKESSNAVIIRRALNDGFFLPVVELLVRDVCGNLHLFAEIHQVFEFHAGMFRVPPGLDGPFFHAKGGIGDD